jgi:hypothetical protein
VVSYLHGIKEHEHAMVAIVIVLATHNGFLLAPLYILMEYPTILREGGGGVNQYCLLFAF